MSYAACAPSQPSGTTISQMRTPSLSDLALAREQLSRLQRMGIKRGVTNSLIADLDTTMDHLLEHSLNGYCVVISGCLLLYSLQQPWFSRSLCVVENLVLRLYKDADPSKVPRLLLELRDLLGASAVLAGDAQFGLMAKYYEAAGYRRSGFEFSAVR